MDMDRLSSKEKSSGETKKYAPFYVEVVVCHFLLKHLLFNGQKLNTSHVCDREGLRFRLVSVSLIE